MEPILQTQSLTRAINGKTIIDNFTFAFEQNRVYNIMGPSGAGKSSLLRLLNRLDEPSGGKILFHGKSHCDYQSSEIRRKIGYLFQTPYLFPATVRDNLLYSAPDLIEAETIELLERTQLGGDFLNNPIDNLSLGEQQRVALARLLAMKPEVLLLDEPTSALDPANTEGIEQLIRNIADQRQQTVIIVTHDPGQALRIGGRALLLVKGKLIESGDAEQIVNAPQTEIGCQYKDRKLK